MLGSDILQGKKMVREEYKQLDHSRFVAALAAAKGRQREGIGTLSEKLLHATLKNYFTDEGDLKEQKFHGSVVDIYGKSGIVEIQTGGCYPLKKKLSRLSLYGEDITVVCPLMRKRTIFWIDPQTAELSGGRKSPKTGKPSDLLPELFYLSELINCRNFTVLLFLYDGEEYKIREGMHRGRTRTHRVERIPTEAVDLIEISCGYDLGALLPDNCPERFLVQDFSNLTGLKGRQLWAALKLLEEQEIITKEKIGRETTCTVAVKEFLKK